MRIGFAAALVLLSCLEVRPAAAQSIDDADRTFVSGQGVNTGDCRRSAPCKSLAYAIDQTPAGGEIVALNPAGYGSVRITKSISIIGPDGGLAQITGRGDPGVQIDAPGAAVSLRGLTIAGRSTAINVDQVGSLVISDVTMQGPGAGLRNNANAAVTLTDVTITGSTASAALATSAGLMTMTRVTIRGNGGAGVQASGGASVVLADSALSNNGSYGVQQLGGVVFAKRSVISNNGNNGALVSGGAFYFDRSTITGNNGATPGAGGGVSASGGSAFSYGNNNVAANAGGDLQGVTPVSLN